MQITYSTHQDLDSLNCIPQNPTITYGSKSAVIVDDVDLDAIAVSDARENVPVKKMMHVPVKKMKHVDDVSNGTQVNFIEERSLHKSPLLGRLLSNNSINNSINNILTNDTLDNSMNNISLNNSQNRTNIAQIATIKQILPHPQICQVCRTNVYNDAYVFSCHYAHCIHVNCFSCQLCNNPCSFQHNYLPLRQICRKVIELNEEALLLDCVPGHSLHAKCFECILCKETPGTQ